MAWTEQRGGSWRVVFRFEGAKRAFTVGEVPKADADAFVASTEELLRLLKRNVVAVPAGCPIEEFLLHRGKPPAARPGKGVELTLDALREGYLAAQHGRLEPTTLAGIRLHFGHLVRVLGPRRVVPRLARADLQAYVNARSAEWIDPNVHRRNRRARDADKPPRSNRKPPPAEADDKPRRHPSAATIRKELVSLRTAWNWARRHLGVAEEFPGGGLDFAKTEDALPFLSWEEAERRVAAGDKPEVVWESVYLRPGEVTELLEWVRGRPVSPWVYPMFCLAAHTGVRRSEMVRALPSDLDLAAGVMTVREKKRDRRRLTTRQVPLSPFLRAVMTDWLDARGNGRALFCKAGGEPITPREAHNYFQRGLRVSKWRVLKGWHVFRHSLISAMANRGVDQRVIDELVGHSTDEQRRRYRHLYPDVKRNAIAGVFDPGG